MSKNSDIAPAPISYTPGNFEEITAIHAKYGKALTRQDSSTSPEYEKTAIENFVLEPNSDRSFEQTLNLLNQWDVVNRVYREDEMHTDEEVYVMENDVAKADSIMIWRAVEEEFGGRTNMILTDFDQIEDKLRSEGVSFLKEY